MNRFERKKKRDQVKATLKVIEKNKKLALERGVLIQNNQLKNKTDSEKPLEVLEGASCALDDASSAALEIATPIYEDRSLSEQEQHAEEMRQIEAKLKNAEQKLRQLENQITSDKEKHEKELADMQSKLNRSQLKASSVEGNDAQCL